MREENPRHIPKNLPEDTLASFDPRKAEDFGGDSVELPSFQSDSLMALPSVTKWMPLGQSGYSDMSAHDLLNPEIEYETREQIGQGGFGEIWEAVQTSLDRVVAVKRLRRDKFQGPNVSAGYVRFMEEAFRREAMTTACLEHPNIVPVHDLAFDNNGKPMLAMKLVRGSVWDKLLAGDFHELSGEEYLAKHVPILLAVAQAVAFAHSRGILHRDIKPAQVMVGEFGEVVLMDWGLAVLYDPSALKGSGQRLSALLAREPTSATSPAGTVAFMAPEQTDTTPGRIGPWTDVYLLGGTLYYVLTGRLPHEGTEKNEVFCKAAMGEVAPVRKISPQRDIPESLAVLVERAMTIDPKERMQSAREFIDSLRDYLSGASQRRESQEITAAVRARASKSITEYRDHAELLSRLSHARTLWPANPDVESLRCVLHEGYARTALNRGDLVLSRLQAESLPPGTTRYELAAAVDAEEARLLRQRRHLQVSRGAVAALMIVLFGGAMLYNRQITDERDATERARALAVENAHQARESQIALERQFGELMAAKRAASSARGSAEDLVAFMIGDLRDRLKVAGDLSLLDGVSVKAAKHYGDQVAQPLSDDEAARVFQGLSQVADLQNTQGNLTDASDSAKAALQLAEAQRESADSSADWELRVALAHERLGGVLSQMTISADEALEHFRLALASLDELGGATSPHAEVRRATLRAQVGTGQILIARGDLEGARVAFDGVRGETRDAAALVAEDPRRAATYAEAEMMLGDVFNTRGSLPDALASYRIAMETFEGLRAAEPNNPDHRVALSETIARIGAIHQRQGELAEALAMYLEDRKVCEELAASDIARADWQQRVIATYARVGQVHQLRGDPAAALAEYHAGLAQLGVRLERDPMNAIWRREAGLLRSRTGDLHVGREEWKEALAEYTMSRDLRVALAKADPSNVTWQSEAAIAENKVGSALEKLGNLDAALTRYEASRMLLEDLAALDPENAIVQRELSASIGSIAVCLHRLGKTGAAIAAQRESLAIAETLVQRDPSNAQWQTDLAVSHNRLGGFLQANTEYEEALGQYLAFRGIIEQLSAQDPTNATWLRELLIGWQRTARISDLLKDRAGAKRDYAEAASVGRRLIERDPTNERFRIEVAGTLVRLATMIGEDADFVGAAESAAEAVKLYEELANAAPDNLERREAVASSSLLCGRLLLSQYLPAEARPYLERAVELTPTDGLEGDKRTLVMVRRAIRTERLAQAYRQLGRIPESKDLYAEAHAMLEEHAAGMTDCEVLCARGVVYAGLGRMTEANDMLRLAGQAECGGIPVRELDEMAIPMP